jgi:hypothetical protein
MHNFYGKLELGSRKAARDFELLVDETFRLILNTQKHINQ